jgi:hypothetical protein
VFDISEMSREAAHRAGGVTVLVLGMWPASEVHGDRADLVSLCGQQNSHTLATGCGNGFDGALDENPEGESESRI